MPFQIQTSVDNLIFFLKCFSAKLPFFEDCRNEITGDVLRHGWNGVEFLLYNRDAAHSNSDSLNKT